MKIDKLILGLLFATITISCLPNGKILDLIKITLCAIVATVGIILLFSKKDITQLHERDVFKRVVEATLQIASELGFNPQVSSNELENGTAIFHTDPDRNLVHLLDLEIPPDGCLEEEINEVIELNREKLTELAKNIIDNKQKEKK
jgi:hypothetical protein